MGLSIDWISAGIFVAGYILSQIRALPAPARYGALALACALIAARRLSMGATAGFNMAFVLVAGGLAVFYGYKAFSVRKR
jgi:hypothetical protein